MRIPVVFAVTGLAAVTLVAALVWLLGTAPPALPVPRLDHSRPRPQGGTYTMAVAEPADLNPLTTVGVVARRGILARTHDTLMDRDPATGALRPAVAEQVASEDGGRRLVFTLRAGVRFADGTPLTVADLLFPFELKQQAGLALGAVGGVLDLVRAARALDDRRLELTLEQVTFTALPTLATGWWVVQRAHFLDAVARRARAAGVAVPAPGSAEFGRFLAQERQPGPGTGPYRLVRWRAGHSIDLLQNEHSWQRSARPTAWNLAGLRFRFVADRAAQFTMLRRGELDLYQDAAAEELLARHPDLAGRFRAWTYAHSGLGHFVVVWNHRRQPLAKAAVRRALGGLFDRRAIAATAFGGKAVASRSWFRPGSPILAGAEDPPPFDLARARQAVQAAGATGQRVELLFAAGQPAQRRIVELSQPAFTAAGVHLQARALEWAALVARLDAREFDAVLLYYSLAPMVDPFERFHSSRAAQGGNHSGYADPEVDRLLVNARQELDAARRTGLYRQFDARFQKDEPVTVLVHPQSSVLLSRRFQGVEPGFLGLHPESWWVEPR